MSTRYEAESLKTFAAKLMVHAGIDPEKTDIIAEILLEGDLMGHTTHGLQMLVPYLKSMEAGDMQLTGQPETIRDTGNNMVIDGQYLPGPWLVCHALDRAAERMTEHGVVTIAKRGVTTYNNASWWTFNTTYMNDHTGFLPNAKDSTNEDDEIARSDRDGLTEFPFYRLWASLKPGDSPNSMSRALLNRKDSRNLSLYAGSGRMRLPRRANRP